MIDTTIYFPQMWSERMCLRWLEAREISVASSMWPLSPLCLVSTGDVLEMGRWVFDWQFVME